LSNKIEALICFIMELGDEENAPPHILFDIISLKKINE